MKLMELMALPVVRKTLETEGLSVKDFDNHRPGRSMKQDIIDAVVEIAAKYTKDKDIWDERDVVHRSMQDLLRSIQQTDFISEQNWSKFLADVKKQNFKYY